MNTNIVIVVFAIFIFLFGGFGSMPFGVDFAAASSLTNQAWNGLEQSEIVNSPYISSSLKKSINKLADEAEESLPIPVLFGVLRRDLIQNYGDTRTGGRTHEGLDIMAPKGAPIVSPTKAVVLSVGSGASSGNTVSTANPGGETFVYMHLDEIADIDKGDTINPGDIIGYCGNTGNASGGPAHLHFEIRDNGATDPYSRLTDEFAAEDKMEIAAAILESSDDRSELAQFLADNYADEFMFARAEGIEIPDEIADLLDGMASETDGEPVVLTVGASGAAVKTLQAYLIGQNKGAAAGVLAKSGATGYFGPLTYAALTEYQTVAGITVDGTYTVPNGARDNFFANLGPARVAGAATADSADKLARIEALKAEIAKIQAQIIALQKQLAAAGSVSRPAAITVDIKIANITQGTDSGSAVNIASGDTLEFQIKVANSGTTVADDIIVRNNFPAGIVFRDDVSIEDGDVRGALESELRVGSIAAGDEKIITCTAKVARVTAVDLTDIAVAYNDNIWSRGTARLLAGS